MRARRCHPGRTAASGRKPSSHARSFRAALQSRRDGARLHVGTEASLDDLEPSERQLAFLAQAGFSVPAAMDLLVAISRYTLGCVLEEQADRQREVEIVLDEAATSFPLVAQALAHYLQGHAPAFGRGLAMLLAGAAKK